jgi:hypothetical protein
MTLSSLSQGAKKRTQSAIYFEIALSINLLSTHELMHHYRHKSEAPAEIVLSGSVVGAAEAALRVAWHHRRQGYLTKKGSRSVREPQVYRNIQYGVGYARSFVLSPQRKIVESLTDREGSLAQSHSVVVPRNRGNRSLIVPCVADCAYCLRDSILCVCSSHCGTLLGIYSRNYA